MTRIPVDEKEVPLVHHFLELRRRLIYTILAFGIAFVFSWHFAREIFIFLVRPLAEAMEDMEGRRLIYTGLAEAFISYMKLAMFAAAFVSLPVALNQVWLFVAPGLYVREKKMFFSFLVATPLFFVAGAAFAYFLVIPAAWKFFLGFEFAGSMDMLPIRLEARVSEYLSIVMQVLLAFGFCFELPVLLVLLGWAGIIDSRWLAIKRKYAFLLILVVSAVLTPPDVLSMIGLAIPLYGLYELSLLLVKGMEKRCIRASEGIKE